MINMLLHGKQSFGMFTNIQLTHQKASAWSSLGAKMGVVFYKNNR
jgi:hypothetical protein